MDDIKQFQRFGMDSAYSSTDEADRLESEKRQVEHELRQLGNITWEIINALAPAGGALPDQLRPVARHFHVLSKQDAMPDVRDIVRALIRQTGVPDPEHE
jgi:hypothetical protein